MDLNTGPLDWESSAFYHEPLFSNTFLTLRKIRFFCSVFVFRRDTSNAILDLVLYLYSEGLNISWKYTSTIPSHYLYSSQHSIYSTLSLTGSQFIFLKCDASIWDLGGKFRRKRIHLFWAFWSWFSKFFLKKETMKLIGWISILHNSLLNAGVRYLLCRYMILNLTYIFFRTFEV